MTDPSNRYAYTLPQKLIAIALAPIVLATVTYPVMRLLEPTSGQSALPPFWLGVTIVGSLLAWLGMPIGIFLFLKGRMEWLPTLAGVAFAIGVLMGGSMALLIGFGGEAIMLTSILYALAVSVTVWSLYLGLCGVWRAAVRCRTACAVNRAS